MALKIGSICTKDDRGEGKKSFWPSVGIIFYDTDDGRTNIKLNMFPDTKFYVFWKDDEKKGQPF